jgi:hypothetical protein
MTTKLVMQQKQQSVTKIDSNKNLNYNQGFRIDSEFYKEEDNRKFKSRRNTIVPRKEVS